MTRDSALVRARTTVRGVMLRQVVANGLGLAMVLLYFWFLFPQNAQDELRDRNLNTAVFGAYVAFMIVIALPLNSAVLHRAVSWVREERPPTDRERRQLFNLPLVETLSAFVSWLVAAVLFGWLNEDVQRISVGLALAGVVTCTMLYLLLEGHFRPLYALALRDAAVPEDRRDVGPRLMFAWLLGSGVPLFAIAISNMISPEPLDSQRLMWVALTSLVAGGGVMWLAARSVERPILRIRDGLRRIERGDLEVDLPVDDLGELGRLTEGVNNLAAGLREREELRDLFHAQVGLAGLADLVKAGEGPTSLGEQREVTVLFVDLRGYTRYAERHSPVEVVAMLNRFFRAVVAVVNREGGWVNKFEGDAALCIFGAPQDQPDHAQRALRAARGLPRELEHTGGPLRAGIGLASGEVLAGFVGTPERYEYTVIGDVVNLAARLCDEAKQRAAGVLASESTIVMAGDDDGWKPSGRLQIRGRRERANVYTPVGESERRMRWPSVSWLGR
jgi:adenylate cyclase